METTADLGTKILRAGAGHGRWRELLSTWSAADQSHRRLILATVQTASNPEFLRRLSGGRHLMVVADEVHRLGSAKHRQIMSDGRFGARLGLSATPERYGDPIGTMALLDFFGDILEPRYGLADAIRDRVLTPYFYRPHPVRLDDLEAEGWAKASAEIGRLQARMRAGDKTPNLENRLKQAAIARARIAKQAKAKVSLAVDVLTRERQAGERWLIYCDDLRQLEAVSDALRENGVQAIPYHSAMDGDREQTLKWLSLRGGVVVAIKCLDEGVDVPAVSHALILASSKNPREFVQRRGRVLRRSEGKALAFIHDAIILPPSGAPPGDDDEERAPDPLTAGELARAIEFAAHAENPASSIDLQQIALEAGIDWKLVASVGAEDEDD